MHSQGRRRGIQRKLVLLCCNNRSVNVNTIVDPLSELQPTFHALSHCPSTFGMGEDKEFICLTDIIHRTWWFLHKLIWKGLAVFEHCRSFHYSWSKAVSARFTKRLMFDGNLAGDSNLLWIQSQSGRRRRWQEDNYEWKQWNCVWIWMSVTEKTLDRTVMKAKQESKSNKIQDPQQTSNSTKHFHFT